MKKIEALMKVLRTRKVAYCDKTKEALFCDGGDTCREYRKRGEIFSVGVARASCSESLLEDEWDITTEEYESLSDFGFPNNYKMLTLEDAFNMLKLPVQERQAEFSDDGKVWVTRTLSGITAGDFPFNGGVNFPSKYCRIKIEG